MTSSSPAPDPDDGPAGSRAVEVPAIDGHPTEATEVGAQMHRLIERLYPICRSITGDGVRETLDVVGELLPLERHEVPSGTDVFDWKVPKEWNIRDAYVADASGRRVVDFRQLNLHVVNYSVPVRRTMSLDELRPRLYSLPQFPDRVPHRTSYFNEDWGFCLRHRDLELLEPGEYEVVIDSTLEDGSLTYAECVIPGETDDEVLLSTHVCHPSLCNDNLSGIALATFLARHLLDRPNRRTYRLLLIPGTIGSITWLARNREALDRIRCGLVLSTAGDAGPLHYKRTRSGSSEIDQAVIHSLAHSGKQYEVRDFEPYGYDERQYSSPGIGLEIGSLTRTPYGQFDEYHTSADDLDFVRPDALEDTLEQHISALAVLDGNGRYVNLRPHGEPQLGRHGLYAALGGRKGDNSAELAVLWVLNFSDGDHSLLDIADRAGLPFAAVRAAADALLEVDLLADAAA
jgi:aminopeptidase-like protein